MRQRRSAIRRSASSMSAHGVWTSHGLRTRNRAAASLTLGLRSLIGSGGAFKTHGLMLAELVRAGLHDRGQESQCGLPSGRAAADFLAPATC